MNQAIEPHDSTLAALSAEGEAVVLSLQLAYLHRSVGLPGSDAGTGWLQPATLTVEAATLPAPLPELPVDISDARFYLGPEREPFYLLPAPSSFAGPVELALELASGEIITVVGDGLIVALQGEATYVEAFAPGAAADA